MTTRRAAAAMADAAAEAVSARPAEAEQLSLLAPSRFQEGGRAHARQVGRIERAGRGRPVGSQNKNNKEIKELFYRLFGDPLLESARWTLHTPESLAAELGCTKGEAFDRLERIRADLRRFFYAPMAAVDADGNVPVPQFTMVNAPGAQVGVVVGGGMPWEGPWSGYDAPASETQQNQALPASPTPVSHGEVSHKTAKDIKT